MNTTAIVVEHLVIGIQTALWVILIIAAVYGYGWIDILAVPSQIITVLFMALVFYPMGVFIDEFSDFCFKRWSLKIRRENIVDDNQTAYRLLVVLKDPSTSRYFQYLRSRIRIARSSVLNFFFLTSAAVFFTQRQLHVVLGNRVVGAIILELFAGSAMILLALFSWKRVSITFARRIKWGYDALQYLKDKNDSKTSRQTGQVEESGN
ncbi:MAG: hypothetical protein KGJ59_12520 [Bacteroidota bacterium]|nr:hypothetical protein [Bacteroidota bacterium]